MAYLLAVGSSDGINVDLKFGEVEEFLVYEVSDGISLKERRRVVDNAPSQNITSDCSSSSCGDSSNCKGGGHGCSGGADVLPKVELISDCRAVICKKVGFNAQKQFEKKAISVFDVECKVNDALEKISSYYGKIDNHMSLRQ